MNYKIILSSVLSLACATSYASTARLKALGESVHLVDVQTVFDSPSDMHSLPDTMAIEFGTPSTVGSTAEGGFIKTVGEGKLGFFLGHGDKTREVGATAETDTFVGAENPLAIVYGMKTGDLPWGVSFNLSSSDLKSTLQKQSLMGLSGSAVIGDLTVMATMGLGDTATGSYHFTDDSTANDGYDDDAKYKGTNMKVAGLYAMGDWNVYAHFGSTTKKVENTAVNNMDEADTDLKVSFVNVMKKEGAEFFYGAGYQMLNNNNKTTSVKTDATQMPVVIGVEADASTWLTLRGSITQNVLLGGTKVTKTDTIGHNTTVAAGAGLKFNKTVIDMTLTMADGAGTATKAGKLDATDIGGKAALTYMF